jgi:hypothetical protein
MRGEVEHRQKPGGRNAGDDQRFAANRHRWPPVEESRPIRPRANRTSPF